MTDPTFTIRINPAECFGKVAWMPVKDIEAVCEKHGIEMKVVEEKYFDFTTDDVKNFFWLGLNFPKV